MIDSEEVKALYLQGFSNVEIAAMFNASASHITRLTKGLPAQPRRLKTVTQQRRRQIQEGYAQGLTQTEVAAQLQISQGRVSQIQPNGKRGRPRI